ncbi:MAG: CHRD domain-containing protein [Roseiflexaceae bacterium]
MNHKSILVALILLLLSVNGAAARPLARPTTPASTAAPAITAVTPDYAQGGCFVAGLNGGNETLASRSNQTQAVFTPATGIGAFILSPIDPLTTTRKLTYSIAYTNTLGPEIAAHIHKGAPGVAGPPIISLPTGNPKEGSPLSLDAQNVADLLAGLLYVNIHTAPNPNGEIRGQILPGGGCFSTKLSGASETPESVGPGRGSGTLLLLPADPVTSTRKLIFDIQFSNLYAAETMAHIHKGAPKVIGPIIEPLPLGSPKRGVLNIQAQTAEDLLAGLLYVNIHSLALMNGEIRGQILPFGGGCYSATLSSSTEVPPNTSTATGKGTFFLTPPTLTTTLKLTYVITYSTTLTATAAHIHKGAQGTAPAGNIVFPLSTNNPITGTLTLNQQQAADLMSGLYYVNVHSATFTQGEIRGQIVQRPCLTVFMPLSIR